MHRFCFGWTTALLLAALPMAVVGTKECDPSELNKCNMPLYIMMFNQKGNMEQQLKQICQDVDSKLQCVQSYTRRCMTPERRSQFNLLYQSIIDFTQKLCDPNGKAQKTYIQISKCLNKKDINECNNRYEETLKSINMVGDGTLDEENVKIICCGTLEFSTCSENVALDQCGSEAKTFVHSVLEKYISKIDEQYCNHIDGYPKICAKNRTNRLLGSTLGIVVSLLLLLLVR